MNIQFVDEPDSDLVKRKSLYIDPESDLSNTLSKIQDTIELEGFTVDRSRYKYIRGKLCKFNIDLISEPDVNALTRRANSMKKLTLNLGKLKWEFNNRVFTLKIGKIQEKELFITVAFLAEVLGDIEKDRIIEIKDSIVKPEKPIVITPSVSFSSPLTSSSSLSNNYTIEEEDEEELTPPPVVLKPIIKQKPTPTPQPKMMSQPLQQTITRVTPIQKTTTNPAPQIIQPKPVCVTKNMHMFKIRG